MTRPNNGYWLQHNLLTLKICLFLSIILLHFSQLTSLVLTLSRLKWNFFWNRWLILFKLIPASFCANLAAFLYRILVEKYRYFSTSLTLSGSGSTPRTGKSLMTSCWQLAFLGHWPKQSVRITEASLFEHLNSGKTFYCKFQSWQLIQIFLKLLIMKKSDSF